MENILEQTGFRGEANVNLTVEHAFKVGRFLGYYYGKDHKANIVIAKIPAGPATCLSTLWLPVLQPAAPTPIFFSDHNTQCVLCGAYRGF